MKLYIQEMRREVCNSPLRCIIGSKSGEKMNLPSNVTGKSENIGNFFASLGSKGS